MTRLKFLDCFCGFGGASEGFHREGFECTGVDIADKAKEQYPYLFIKGDMNTLKGEDYRGYDVIWGSPPCRDFSSLGPVIGHRWKRPPDPEFGLILVRAFRKFVEGAKPTFWILENVDRLRKYYPDARIVNAVIKGNKRHAFWGVFPPFLLPQGDSHKYLATGLRAHGREAGKYLKTSGYDRKTVSWINAKLPLSISSAFAKACKDALIK